MNKLLALGPRITGIFRGAGTLTCVAAALAAAAFVQPVAQSSALLDVQISWLEDDDPEVRERAALALGRLSDPKAYAALEAAGLLDWPTWGYDAARSAGTPYELAETLHLQWVRELPEPKQAWTEQWDNRGKLDFDVSYAPVVKGNRIFVPSSVTDSVTAYDIADGSELWRFYADGPVRLAPAAWEDRVYFVSDDGHLYCVEAESGTVAWKFQGGPTDQRFLGNERIINFWAARGGPAIADGTIYFTAGFWPMHGVFIYALDARTGAVEWVNDGTSSAYVALPHGGAYGYGSIAPQGYIAVDGDRLVVSGGRTEPAILDRHTGEVVELELRTAKGTGGYDVHAGGMGAQRNDMIEARVEALVEAGAIEGEVFERIAAHGRLFVSTEDGKLYCFGADEAEAVRYPPEAEALQPKNEAFEIVAKSLLEELGETDGYGLVLGAGSGDLLKALLAQSKLHLVVVESDAERVRNLRDELVAGNLYGRRAAVVEADPATFAVQPYLFSLVVSEDAAAAGLGGDGAAMAHTLDRLRPYGGVAYFGGSTEQFDSLREASLAAEVDQVAIEAKDDHLFARRSGPLTGAGAWTHQHRDPENTLMSQDKRVRLPLGLLWFGGPNNHNILPRHSGGPRPQVVDGRITYLGVENVAARCVYTGRQLWDVPFPGIGHPFTNLELEERWQRGMQVYMTNIPGATYIGSPIVSLEDSVYLRYEAAVHRLDPRSGETVAVFDLPGTPVKELYDDPEAPDWGHLSVQGDFVITTAEPHLFEDQALGWTESYTGTSSNLLVVLDRKSGEVLWQREAEIGFRHNTIVSTDDRIFVIDGLSKNALEHMARRGIVPDEDSVLMALDPRDGSVIWRTDQDVFGTFLLFSKAHDILIEGGSQDLRRTLEDEPRQLIARRGADGGVLWESGANFTLPGAVHGDMLIPGRPAAARSIITGEEWVRRQPHTGETSAWEYSRTYGCNTVSASEHMLFYRSGAAGFFDFEHDSGTGNFGGFRSGCTSNLVAADGVLSALDFTRTCTCNYQHQTSLAMINMPGDTNIELWTRHDAAAPNPERHGINFGAPGRRVDHASGTIWFDGEGSLGRHASAIDANGFGLPWVASFAREFAADEDGAVTVYDLLDGDYTVRLHFAELDESVEPGDRVFDVLVGDEVVLEHFDIAAAAEGNLRAVVKEIRAKVPMTMDITLRPAEGSKRGPLINGIELVASDGALASAR